MTEPDDSRQPARRAPARILVLNHHRDPLDDLTAELRGAGHDVVETTTLAESRQAVRTTDPAVVVLDPLILKAGGVEMELVESLQRDDAPVPVLFLIDDMSSLEEARHTSVAFRDFVMKPHSVPEVVHRIELQLLARTKFLALQQRARDLEGQVSVDFKTGLLSERHFKNVLQIEFKRAQRHCLPLSLVLVDVDDFKTVNDTTEYAFGDEVLRRVARELRENTRESDFAARFGGDEFVLLLPHTTSAEAVNTAMRIRKKIATSIVQSGAYRHQVTVSIGIDTFDGRGESSAEELRRHANKALQEAKRRGKDQVWLFSERAGLSQEGE